MKRVIAYDTETHLIEPGIVAPPMVCISFAESRGGEGASLGLMGAEEGREWWRVHIKDPKIIWVGHNVAFDMVVMMNECPDTVADVFMAYRQNRVRCTMIREFLILNAMDQKIEKGQSPTNVGLAGCVKRMGGRDRSAEKGPDAWRTRYAELDGIPVELWPQAAIDYPLADAMDTLRLYYHQSIPVTVRPHRQYRVSLHEEREAGEMGVKNELEQVRAALALQLMTVWGMRVDYARAERLALESEEKLAWFEHKLKKMGIMRKCGTLDKHKQKELIAEAVLDSHGRHYRDISKVVDIATSGRGSQLDSDPDTVAALFLMSDNSGVEKTKGGDISTKKEVLEKLPPSDKVQTLLDYRKVKTRTQFFESLLRSDGRPLTPGYNAIVETGRTSSRNPNIQNFPRSGGERACFMPRDGHLFVIADYSTLELRAWAQVCLDKGIESEMAKALIDGVDLHSSLGAEIMGVSYEEMQKYLAGDYGPEMRARAKKFRGAAKPANFGLPVGMSAATLERSARNGYGVDFSDLGTTAEEIRAAWYRRWPEAQDYFSASVRGMVTGWRSGKGEVTVEQPKSGRVRARCRYAVAANTFFQGMAADGAKEALWQLALECYDDPDSPMFGCRPLAFIHDEILLEAPEARVQNAAKRLEEIMIEGMEKYITRVPILVDVAISDRWTKEAESARNPDGTLTIWRYHEASDK